jgi:transposase
LRTLPLLRSRAAYEFFAIDAQAREQGLSQEDRQLLRLGNSKPLLEQIKTQIQTARSGALPKSVLAKACNYTLTLWARLTRFLEHSLLELSNNLAENAMRGVALGRRNWIHIGSEQAGPRVAAVVSEWKPADASKIPINRIAELTPASRVARD